jgi:hypothetical protein
LSQDFFPFSDRKLDTAARLQESFVQPITYFSHLLLFHTDVTRAGNKYLY